MHGDGKRISPQIERLGDARVVRFERTLDQKFAQLIKQRRFARSVGFRSQFAHRVIHDGLRPRALEHLIGRFTIVRLDVVIAARIQGIEFHLSAAFDRAVMLSGVAEKMFERRQQKSAEAATRRIGACMIGALDEACEERLRKILCFIGTVSARANDGEHRRVISATQRFERRARLDARYPSLEHETPPCRLKTIHVATPCDEIHTGTNPQRLREISTKACNRCAAIAVFKATYGTGIDFMHSYQANGTRPTRSVPSDSCEQIQKSTRCARATKNTAADLALRGIFIGLCALAVALPVRAQLPSMLDSVVTQVTVGGNHACALTATGAVECWGSNGSGQLGNDTMEDSHIPTDVSGLSAGIVAIAVGLEHTCALTATGGVKCWGDNSVGQLGDNTTIGRLTPVDVVGLSVGVVAIAAGAGHTCALTFAGRVKCWGGNVHGELGDDTTIERDTPTFVTSIGASVVGIVASSFHTCTLTVVGSLKCWGENADGELGDNSTTERHVPVGVVGLSAGVAALATGNLNTCALTIVGSVKCWGNNFYGQIGDNTTSNRLVPVEVSGLSTGIEAITVGFAHICARNKVGGVLCWGSNINGELGDDTGSDRHTPTNVSGLSTGVVAISAAYANTCALTETGGVKCWGYNIDGQLGDGTVTQRASPVSVATLSAGVIAIAAGAYHVCALTGAGGAKCWGYNAYGALGDNSPADRLAPVDVDGLSAGVTALAAGDYHTCALIAGGYVVCWGDNYYGAVGDNTVKNRLTPVAITAGLGVTAIAAGAYHTCALTRVGGINCWGYNFYGQLGIDTTTDRHSPIPVIGISPDLVTAIAAGAFHTCALIAAVADNGVKCWGDNSKGQLGDNTIIQRNVPVNVSGLSVGIIALATGDHHTCALTRSGGVKCWGDNSKGQLGDGSVTERHTATDVIGLDTGVTAIAAGASHTCAATAAGMMCWGDNSNGQLGDDAAESLSATPVNVGGISAGVTAITAGSSHTCAVTSVGALKCWGDNSKGQLGNGTTVDSSVPIAIRSGQKMQFAPLTMAVGSSAELNATASSGGQIAFDTWTLDNAPTGTCHLSGDVLTVTAPALCGVRASQIGFVDANGNDYAPAPQQLRLIHQETPIFTDGFE
jgi:alpha-tubulin suppressor-like RCC1 family protein